MNKLLVVYTLFISLFVSEVSAAKVLNEDDRKIAEMARAINKNPQVQMTPPNMHEIAAKKMAASAFNEIKESSMKAAGVQNIKIKIDATTLIFVSESLSDVVLDDLYYQASVDQDVVLVYQGVVNPDNIGKSMMSLQNRASKQDPASNVIIDPTLFVKHGIRTVPTIVVLNKSDGERIASVSGLASPAWIRHQISAGNEGNLGQKGPVTKILEKNLIEVMQEKMAKIDWDKKKENAVNRFWTNQKFEYLPGASHTKTRIVDPTLVLTHDFLNHEGDVIVPKGTMINPLKLRPFNMAIIVFDPLVRKQVEIAQEEYIRLRKDYDKVKVIVTQFDTVKGWDNYKELSDAFDEPVFKLTPDIISTFELEHVPSVITSNNTHFIINEISAISGEVNE